MNERAEHLKTLIRHSSKAELEITKLFFNNLPCSEKMSEQKKQIQEAIKYLKKDGGVNITLVDKGEDYIITLEVI